MVWGDWKERVKTFLFYAMVVYTSLLWLFTAGFFFGERNPHEGDPCGPFHRWAYIGAPFNQELTCRRIAFGQGVRPLAAAGADSGLIAHTSPVHAEAKRDWRP